MKKNIKEIELIELNEQFVRALKVMEETSKNVFVTGKAGTGKSTLLEYFRAHTKKRIVVLAPTGVAALNVRGQTIHSFFRFKPHVTLESVKKVRRRVKDGLNDDDESIYKKLDAIVIDEVSMVRADIMDCMDRFMRLNGRKRKEPFGGVQMIFIGDLYQLPPVVTSKEKEIFTTHYTSPWFFDARVMDGLRMEFIELEKVYRQKDESFISLLNAIRNNSVTDKELEMLNQRYDPDFSSAPEDFYIWLTSINEAAEKINMEHLSALDSELMTYQGRMSGDFKPESLPTQTDLSVKVGAQVMLLNNDSYGRWVNGSIGRIEDIEHANRGDNGDVLIVELTDGDVVDVTPYTWEIFHYSFNKEKKRIESEVVGSFTQYPLKLAWAVTIHKSQGKTFDRAVIDIGRGTFATGQVYVALSRCTKLDGIVLKKPIQKKHIFMDWRVVKFVTRYQYQLSERDRPLEEKVKLIEHAIKTRTRLKIVYLKNNDVKSRRVVTPSTVGRMEYLEKPFLGMEAFCHARNEERVFRVDRILEMEEVSRIEKSDARNLAVGRIQGKQGATRGSCRMGDGNVHKSKGMPFEPQVVKK